MLHKNTVADVAVDTSVAVEYIASKIAPFDSRLKIGLETM